MAEGSNGKIDISVVKLLNYNLVFFIPLLLLYSLTYYLGLIFAPRLQIPATVVTQVLMFFLSMISFFVLIPILRKRETINGVRFALINFIVTGFIMTIPSLVMGNYSILMHALILLANFIFVTFITSPDVIGISGDPEDWFKHKVQIIILTVYISVVLLYIAGFGWMYFEIFQDTTYVQPYNYFFDAEQPLYFNFFYFSMEIMASGGSGNIVPASVGARLVKSCQSLISMMINLIFISTLLMYVSYSQSTIQSKVEGKIREEEKVIEKEVEEIEEKENKLITDEESDRIQDIRKRYPNYMNGRDNTR